MLWNTLNIMDDVMFYFYLMAVMVAIAGLTVRRVPFHARLLGNLV